MVDGSISRRASYHILPSPDSSRSSIQRPYSQLKCTRCSETKWTNITNYHFPPKQFVTESKFIIIKRLVLILLVTEALVVNVGKLLLPVTLMNVFRVRLRVGRKMLRRSFVQVA